MGAKLLGGGVGGGASGPLMDYHLIKGKGSGDSPVVAITDTCSGFSRLAHL